MGKAQETARLNEAARRGIDAAGTLIELCLKDHGPLVRVEYNDNIGVPFFRFQDGWVAYVVRDIEDNLGKKFGVSGPQFYIAGKGAADENWKYSVLATINA